MNSSSIAPPRSSPAPRPPRGGLVARLRRSASLGPRRRAQGAAPPRSTPGSWSSPTTRVVIRIARSEMGQGTLTGLAQLVAEELECDWSKVTHRIPDARPEPRAQARLGQLLHRRQPRHPRVARIRAQGRRGRAHDAGAGRGRTSGRCRSPNARQPTASSPHAAIGPHAPPTARSPPPPPSSTPPDRTSKLKDPKDWKIAGKPRQARWTRSTRSPASRSTACDLKLPGMLNAAIKDCPVFGGKVKSFDAAKVAGMPGVKKVVQVGDTAVAVVADTWWQAKTALDALPIDWDEGPNAKVSSATIAAMLKAGLDADQAVRRQQERRRARPRLPPRRRRSRRSTPIPYQNHAPMEPMNATARYTPESARSGRRRRTARRHSPPRAEAVGPAGRQVRGLQDPSRWRLRPARRVTRLRAPGRADRQADARHAGQADLVARRRHGAGPLSSGHAMQAGRRASTRTAT